MTEKANLRLLPGDDDSEHPASKCHNCLIACVPEKSPAAWLVINLLLLLSSVFLLYAIIVTDESPLERPYGQQFYLAWSFVTTVAWCIEVGLTIWYHGLPNSTAVDRVQLLLGLYFLFGSIQSFRQWQHPDEDVNDELLDAIISAVCYLWVLVTTAQALSQQQQQQQQQQQAASTLPEAAAEAKDGTEKPAAAEGTNGSDFQQMEGDTPTPV